MSRPLLEKIIHRIRPLRRVGRESSSLTEEDRPRPSLSIVDDPVVVRQVFDRLRGAFEKRLYKNRGLTADFRLEHGAFPDGMRYFFVSPWHESGWLFEQSPTGWSISRSERIVHQNSYVRGSVAWDLVTLLTRDPQKSSLVRLNSRVLGEELMTFPIYEKELSRSLNLEPGFL